MGVENDDVWGDFISSPTTANGNPAHPTAVTSPGPARFQIPSGAALPLSFFGDIEFEEQNPSNININNITKNSNGWFDPKPPPSPPPPAAQSGKIKVVSKQQIKPENGSDLNFNVDDDDDDDWEFMAADFANHFVAQDFPKSSVNKTDPFMMINTDKQADQDASISAGPKHDSGSSFPQFVDQFAVPVQNGTVHKSDEMDIGFNFNSSKVTTNGFMTDSFPGAQVIGNGNGISATSVNEDDDFGDFIDASREVWSSGQEHVVPQTATAEVQFENGTIQDKPLLQEKDRGALPLSLFSDYTEESSDGLKLHDEIIQKPVSSSGNGFSSQASTVSIHDLISNLYSQAQQTSSVDPDQKPSENGVHFSPEMIDLNQSTDNDDWDDSSWEFKDAFSNAGVQEQLSSHIPETVSQKPSETSSNLMLYMNFYTTLKETLCFLLQNQLKEEKKAQSSGAAAGDDGKSESLGDVQEACKTLEDKMISQEILSEKYLERNTCLIEILETLQGSQFKMIDYEYSLSKQLQLAANEWRITTKLLKHVISVLHVLSLGSAVEQSVYVSTWSKIIDVCAVELKYGGSIWKRASEKNVQQQILSDRRGQRYFQALGEIYKAVELLGLSATLYKPWMLLSVPPPFLGHLNECRTLWSSSGLEEALLNLSDNVDFGFTEPAKALVASIKNVRDLDVCMVYDRVFTQQKSVCRLSLLPQEMLTDLKAVLWDEEPYFLNLANLWANLIDCNPPGLPNLQVG